MMWKGQRNGQEKAVEGSVTLSMWGLIRALVKETVERSRKGSEQQRKDKIMM